MRLHLYCALNAILMMVAFTSFDAQAGYQAVSLNQVEAVIRSRLIALSQGALA